MAQHDYNLANQSGADFRADLNNALSAIVTVNSGASAPSTTFAHQLWVDTSSNVLKIRNAANDAWVTTGLSITADNTFTGNITGNADTATALATARTINGASFDGTANISFGTDSVSEGGSNLYFTNARVESYLDAGTSTPTFASAVINTSITGSAILDDDSFGTASATTVATSESIKAYVDSQIGSVDTLAEILLNGNTTGGTDIAFGDNDKAIFGTGSDLLIYHDGSNSWIKDAGTGDLVVRSSTNIFLQDATGANNYAKFTTNAVELRHNNDVRFTTTSTGIDVTGTVTADGLTVDGTAFNFNKTTSGLGGIYFNDASNNGSAVLSNGSNAQALRLWTDRTDASNFGYLEVVDGASAKRLLLVDDSGDISFYDDTGTSENLKWDASADTLNFVDGTRASFGAGNDLRIFHDGNHSYIEDGGTGNLRVRATNLNLANLVGNNYINCVSGGAVTLYHNNAAKLATTSSGIDITGTVTSDGLVIDTNTDSFNDNAKLEGLVGDIRFNYTQFGGSGNYGGSLDFYTKESSTVKRLRQRIANNGDISFYDNTGSTQALFWDASAERLGIATTSPDYSLDIEDTGSTLLRLRSTSSDGALQLSVTDTTSLFDIKFGDTGSNSRGKIRYRHDGDSLAFSTAGTEALRIDSSQRVGIGTTSPTNGNLQIGDSDADFNIAVAGARSKFGYDSSNNSAVVQGGITKGIIFCVNNSTFGSGEAARFDASGNFGIGTTNPTSTLTVDGTINNVAIKADETDFVDSILISLDGATGTLSSATSNTGLGTQVLANLTSGDSNVAVGRSSLNSLTTGSNNTSVGRNALLSNTTASNNVAVGYSALSDNTTGQFNTAIGRDALGNNTTASNNTAIGYASLQVNTTGSNNTAVGYETMKRNTTGIRNAAIGQQALAFNTTGNDNTALGLQALFRNTTGANNVAVGYDSLEANTTGGNNVAVGHQALDSNTEGGSNVAIGRDAMQLNTTGQQNVAMGYEALHTNSTGHSNTAIGHQASHAITTGIRNTALGYQSLRSQTTATGTVAVGHHSLYNNTTGSGNVAVGYTAMSANQTGGNNTAVGYAALENNTGSDNTAFGKDALEANTTGEFNVAIGKDAATANTTGASNVAVGANALKFNTTANNNTAVGTDALLDNTTGQYNTAIGRSALANNTTANNNTALGYQAAQNVTTGSQITAIGYGAADAITDAGSATAVGWNCLGNATVRGTGTGAYCLSSLTTGANNVAFGYYAMNATSTGASNAAFGDAAMQQNTTGSSNVAVGRQAVQSNTTGTNNIGLGFQALKNNTIGNSNVGVGYQALLNTTGYDNTGLGKLAGELITTGDNNTCIGNDSNPASATTDNSITLGDANITSLRCNTQTISALSDARDKTNVEDLQLGVEFIKDLRPVSFTWDRRDGSQNGVEDFGFIAQELDAVQEKHNEAERLGLVLKDNPDKLEASYGKLVPMLVKAIQEQQEQIEELKQKLGE